jgi:hypothetical protein
MERFWLFVHIASAFGLAFSHGASVAMMFRLRRETDPVRIGAMLDLSLSTLASAGISLLALLVSGVVSTFLHHAWGAGWIWVSLVLLVAITGVMTPLAANHYNRVREAVGAQTWDQRRKGIEPGPPRTPEEVAALLRSRRPEAVTAVGGIGFLAILWLMVYKPF